MTNTTCDYCNKEVSYKFTETNKLNKTKIFCNDECLIKYIKARFYDEDNNTWAI